MKLPSRRSPPADAAATPRKLSYGARVNGSAWSRARTLVPWLAGLSGESLSMSAVKVLLVDDVRLFIEFERLFFERAGCSILTASSGEDALRMVREDKPHIVLLDYEMPGMMGDEVCRRIKESEATRHV